MITTINEFKESYFTNSKKVSILNDERRTFYHATLSKNLNSIKQQGLLLNQKSNDHGFNTANQISLATTYNDAFYYGSLFNKDKQPMTVLIIKLPKTFNVYRGLSHTEFIVKQNIAPMYILGAYKDNQKLDLKYLNDKDFNININLLHGKDKDVAQQMLAN